MPLKGYGQSVDELLCATIGSCPAHASYAKLGMELFKQAPRAVTWLGLSASTMWNGKVKNFVTEAVDWVKPHILHTPIEQLVIEISIRERWGEDAPKILSTPAELEKAIKIEMGEYDGKKITILNQDYIGAPKTLPAFPDAVKGKKKTPKQGNAGLRERWEDKKNIYEWDYRHGAVEKYNNRGHHLGEFDPNTGNQTKPADPSRRIEP